MNFSVAVSVTLQISGTFDLKAKNQEAAEEKAQELINDGTIAVGIWTMTTTTNKLNGEWEQTEETVELDSVDQQ